MHFAKTWKKRFTDKNLFLVLSVFNFIIFGLLLARNPFSLRTLIPNLEPYPDTIHYLNSAISFIHGYGFHIVREGRILNISVPPLYSLVNVPLLFIKSDPRMFYFTNVFLSLIGLFLFVKILRKITGNPWIISLTSFLYVTNYFLYWYPSLAMAENLTIPLFLLSFYLLLLPVTRKNTIVFGMLAWCLYLTKYASIPLTLMFLSIYLFKIIALHQPRRKKVVFIPLLLIGAVFYLAFEQLTKGSTFISATFFILGGFFREAVPDAKPSTSFAWFSLSYIPANLPLYIKSLAGSPQKFLWDYTPILPTYLAMISLAGLVWSLFKKQARFMGVSLISLLLASMLFMSTFYSFDMRYMYHAIPTLLIGFGLLINFLYLSAKQKPTYIKIFYVFLVGIFLVYSGMNVMRMKRQVMVNLKYAETPWYYISVLELNKYFSKPVTGEKKPVLISALIPYYIDFYSNKNYELLPLDQDQEFRNAKTEAWGANDYSSLVILYKKYLKDGYALYVHNYGLGHEQDKIASYENIKKTFKLTLVQESCLGACNIYKVDLK